MDRICAAIFDMDGLLIDTEPIWRRAETEIFGRLGLHLTEEQCLETMGVRLADVVEMWYRRHPWQGPSPTEVAREIEDAVIQHVRSEGAPKPGVCDALATVHAAKLQIAIASSSSEPLIDAVVEKLHIEEYVQVRCSGDAEPQGKPHPGVYLTAARKMGVDPDACLALEDSPNGVLSAKRAGMFCIAVPDPYLASDPRMQEADLVLSSLELFTPALIETLHERSTDVCHLDTLGSSGHQMLG